MTQDNSYSLWKNRKGRQEIPEYNIRKECFDSGFQSSLDSYRSWNRFEEKTRETHNKLLELYGPGQGVNTSIIYGSGVSGLALSPDSIRNAGLSADDESDMDVLLLVEDGHCEEARVNLAQREMTTRNGKRPYVEDERFPLPEINAITYTKEEFLEDLQDSRAQAKGAEDLLDEEILMKMPYHEFNVNYVKRIRAFDTGYIPHSDFADPDVIDEIEHGLELISNENGEVESALHEAYHDNSPDYSRRLESLNENYRQGVLWRSILRSTGVPREYKKNDDGFLEDQLEPHKLEPEDLVKRAEEEVFGEEPGIQSRLGKFRDLVDDTLRSQPEVAGD